MTGGARRGRFARARRAAAWALAAALAGSLALACASIIGIDDRLPEEPTTEADTADQERAPDTSVTGELCGAGTTCAAVPEGWQLASLDPLARTACADGYDTPEDVVVAGDGLGCTCRCTETTRGSCAALGSTTTFRDYPAAGCSSSINTYTLTSLDGGCEDASITTTPAVRIPTPPAAAPACAADASPSALQNGRTCAARGTACSDGGLCARALPPGQLLCVTKAGDVACPAGYAKKLPAGTATGADTRVCGTCTCTADTACDTPVLQLFKGVGCKGAVLDVPATGSCTNEEAGITYAAYRYVGKAPGCRPSVPALLDGGVTISSRKTVCCRN